MGGRPSAPVILLKSPELNAVIVGPMALFRLVVSSPLVHFATATCFHCGGHWNLLEVLGIHSSIVQVMDGFIIIYAFWWALSETNITLFLFSAEFPKYGVAPP